MSVLRPKRRSDSKLAYTVDRSWGNVRADLDGNMFPSDHRKYHRGRPDDDDWAGAAACSRRILLNDDAPGEDPATLPRAELCRRCFPERREYLYVVAEQVVSEMLYEVMATSQAEAIARVRDNGEALDRAMSDSWPTGKWAAMRGGIGVAGMRPIS